MSVGIPGRAPAAQHRGGNSATARHRKWLGGRTVRTRCLHHRERGL